VEGQSPPASLIFRQVNLFRAGEKKAREEKKRWSKKSAGEKNAGAKKALEEKRRWSKKSAGEKKALEIRIKLKCRGRKIRQWIPTTPLRLNK
jgi:hypothetical protein